MEIGSFLELDLRNTGELYTGNNVVRLNSARAGIVHACMHYNVKRIYIPYYQCPTVSSFLTKNGIQVIRYSLSENFHPEIETNDSTSAFLLVNYFGIFSGEHLQLISKKFNNVIIDNSQAFYNPPISNCLNIYSPRKFFGVPDGCYVIGENILNNSNYQQDESSDTAAFLLKRIEKGCSQVYSERMLNEERIDKSGVLQMSKLTHSLLSAIDYESIAQKRKNNFLFAHELYKSINLINPLLFFDDYCVPMVYPLVLKNENIVKQLSEIQIYTGRWWNYVLNETEINSFESFLSQYMIPLPIDQRYSQNELQFVASKLKEMNK